MKTLLIQRQRAYEEVDHNTAKKQAFAVRKTKVEFTESVAIYYRLPVFCLRKIRRFLRVFASVNPSIRSIIR